MNSSRSVLLCLICLLCISVYFNNNFNTKHLAFSFLLGTCSTSKIALKTIDLEESLLRFVTLTSVASFVPSLKLLR